MWGGRMPVTLVADKVAPKLFYAFDGATQRARSQFRWRWRPVDAARTVRSSDAE
jgi:hypothetical protein